MPDDLEIRRPELLGVRRTGTIRWYKDEKGYGRITADDGEVLVVHFSGIEGDCYRSLPEGRRVSFVWEGRFGGHRRHADQQARPGDERRPRASTFIERSEIHSLPIRGSSTLRVGSVRGG
jgi:CspA family cold shock protein